MKWLFLYFLKFIDTISFAISRLLYRERKVTDDVAVVTGGANGIGRGICEELLQRGAKVAILDVNKNQLDKTVDELRSSHEDYSVHGYICDISKLPEVDRVMKQVAKEVGDIDILVNNAGIIHAGSFLEHDVSMVEKTIAVNLLGQFWTIRSVLSSMKARGKGMIINISSMAGIGGTPTLFAYAASKGGVIRYSESLRRELFIEKSPVSIHVCMPFMIATNMNDTFFPPAVGRNESISNVISPKECAKVIVGESLRGHFKIFVPHSSAITAFVGNMLPFLPQWVENIVAAQSGFDTLEAK